MNSNQKLTVLVGSAVGVLAVAVVASLAVAQGNDLEGSVAADVGVASTNASDECVGALDAADELIDFAVQGLDKGGDALIVASTAFGAAADFDIDGMEDASDDITEISEWFQDNSPKAGALRDAYDTAKAECLS